MRKGERGGADIVNHVIGPMTLEEGKIVRGGGGEDL